MAVAVEQVPYVVLDEEYRIVEVGPAAAPWFAQHAGENVFDCFPGSRRLFRPYYDEAVRTGEVVEFAQFYGGYVTHVKMAPSGARLTVSWETLGILDTWTLEGLRASLREMLARVTEVEQEIERRRIRNSLRLIERRS